jgi:hypothetical protein
VLAKLRVILPKFSKSPDDSTLLSSRLEDLSFVELTLGDLRRWVESEAKPTVLKPTSSCQLWQMLQYLYRVFQ